MKKKTFGNGENQLNVIMIEDMNMKVTIVEDAIEMWVKYKKDWKVNFVSTDNPRDAVLQICSNEFDIWMFDNDLGHPMTGHDVLKAISKRETFHKPLFVTIHSCNVVEAPKMKQTCEQMGLRAQQDMMLISPSRVMSVLNHVSAQKRHTEENQNG